MIGIDLVEVERIKKSMKNVDFINRILTKREIEYINSFVDKDVHVAGFFAVKEAVMKALENCKKIGFMEIEVCHNDFGKPYVKLYGEAKSIFEKLSYNQIEISISHTKNYATAICLIN